MEELIEYEVRPRRQAALRCQCGTDLPGTCPGPRQCPYAALDDDEHEPTDLEEAHA